MSKKINGLLIDCSRLIEKHDYYYKLIDFMSDWDMNTLLLHFSDDHGCSIEIPGFKELACDNAFTAKEIRDLDKYALSKNIEIIPELEVFGHTRYITDLPQYKHLYTGAKGKKTKELTFNSLDTFNKQTHSLVKRLIKATAKLFKSEYIHLGCDEVDISINCKKHNVDKEETWASYVNDVIEYAKNAGKKPMIWADHLVNSKKISDLLRKDVTIVHWDYEPKPKAGIFSKLKKYGFKKIISAPSLLCYHSRYLVTQRNIDNTKRMIIRGIKYGALGTINTIWNPERYVQESIYYGIAYSAYLMNKNGKINKQEFRKLFAKKTFGVNQNPSLNNFLRLFEKADLPWSVIEKFIKKEFKLSTEEKKNLIDAQKSAKICLDEIVNININKNKSVFEAMVLALRAVWVTSEGLLIINDKRVSKSRKNHYNKELLRVKKDLSEDWNNTRFPNDPRKKNSTFLNMEFNHAILLVETLPKFK